MFLNHKKIIVSINSGIIVHRGKTINTYFKKIIIGSLLLIYMKYMREDKRCPMSLVHKFPKFTSDFGF